jgi:acyl-CoA thioester hydrolase
LKPIKAYRKRVQYYETDRMGITHNSNYFRWFEEARIDFMHQSSWPYLELEEMGIFMPIASESARFIAPTRFYDEVMIKSKMTHYNGYKCTVEFEVTRLADHKLCTTGEVVYAIVDREGKPIKLSKDFPEIDSLYINLLNYQSEE